jgi:hypothetical protein
MFERLRRLRLTAASRRKPQRFDRRLRASSHSWRRRASCFLPCRRVYEMRSSLERRLSATRHRRRSARCDRAARTPPLPADPCRSLGIVGNFSRQYFHCRGDTEFRRQVLRAIEFAHAAGAKWQTRCHMHRSAFGGRGPYVTGDCELAGPRPVWRLASAVSVPPTFHCAPLVRRQYAASSRPIDLAMPASSLIDVMNSSRYVAGSSRC